MARKLTIEETYKCLKAWRELHDLDAHTLLTLSNGGLVKYMANKHLEKGFSREELESIGYVGLLRAIEKFDYINGDIRNFSSYIATSIENEMKYEIKKWSKHNHVQSFEQPIKTLRDGHELTVEDIIGTDAEELMDEIITNMEIKLVREALQCLTTRQKQIILLRYGLDKKNQKTQQEIAEQFGIARTTVANQEKYALVKMRNPKYAKKLCDLENA